MRLEKQEDGFAITAVHLELSGKVPGIGEEAFMKLAQAAKEGCPVSKVLNAKITLEAELRP